MICCTQAKFALPAGGTPYFHRLSSRSSSPRQSLTLNGGTIKDTVGTNPKVTQGGYKNLYRIIASDSQVGSSMATYAAKVLKVTIDPTSGAAVAVVRETANTLVVSRISFLQKYDVVRASEEETPNSA